ncbi:glycoside hydrolase domain-containing protein [Nocardioides ultimimeridianus]
MLARRSPVLRASLTTLTALLVLAALLASPLATRRGEPTPLRLSATTGNPVTPGDFRGYGFDQCSAPAQAAMSAWMQSSPFLAVGIYISGNSRACRSQPNLTTGWVRTQLAAGWKLLPITLGPQASCNPRYPRYSAAVDPTISPNPGAEGLYGPARTQGRAEAAKTADAASALGIAAGSTLWYDLESFDTSKTACRESALSFLSAYTDALHRHGYVSGVYSSAGSGIAMLDQVRANRPTAYTLPDAIWIARWDEQANTSTTYISNTGWNPHRRVKQYQGGHDETWGGVRINIDRDYLDLGRGAYAPVQRPCGGISLDLTSWPTLDPASATAKYPAQVKVLQCMLRARKYYTGSVDGRYTPATITALHHWKADHGFGTSDHGRLTRRVWVAFLAAGTTPTLKVGSAGLDVRRLQRTLDAAYPLRQLPITGIYGSGTQAVVKTYQSDRGLKPTGILTAAAWVLLIKGQA